MKRLLNIKIFLVVLLLVVFGVAAQFAWRTNEKKMRLAFLSHAQIAFVDMKRLREESLGAQKFKELIERQHKQFEEEIIIQEKKLREQYDHIKEAKIKESPNSVPSKENRELQKKITDFEQNLNDLHKITRKRKESLNQDFSKIEANIEKTITTIVKNIAQKQKLNLIINATVMDTSVVLYGGQELDITDDVLIELNKQIPTVHLSDTQS